MNTKQAIIATSIAGLLTIFKLILQSRAARQASLDKKEAEAELARLRREADERAARHAREAEERAAEVAERKAERELRDKLFAENQAATARTLAFMESQLKASQEAGASRYAIIERNTATTEKLATACAEQARELRVMVDRVARLEGGAGCKAPFGGKAA